MVKGGNFPKRSLFKMCNKGMKVIVVVLVSEKKLGISPLLFATCCDDDTQKFILFESALNTSLYSVHDAFK